VTGRSYGIGSWDYATVKYNTSGIQQWVERYNGISNDDDEAYSIAVDGTGNVYVTGYSLGTWSTGVDIVTIKYNTSGILQWLKIYAGQDDSQDEGHSIKVDGAGSVYVTGIGGDADYVTIKYNSSGVQQWVQSYNGPGNYVDEAYSIVVDSFGNVYVTGESWGETYYDYATIKYNSSGIQQWVTRYNGPSNDFDKAVSLVVDGSGNVYATGWSFGNITGWDYATVKYSSLGVQQWVQRYNGPADSTDIPHSMAIDGSANIYVTGYSRAASSSGWGDYATIRYSSSGVQQWVQRYNGPGNGSDRAYSITLDASGNVYVTGYSTGTGTYYDYATIKYSQSVGVKPISNEVPKQFALSQNYPNPFNPITKIKFAIPLSRGVSEGRGVFVTLKIYDILGREVATLVNEQLSLGTYEVEWDASNYPSGVYFYKLITSEHTETKRMVLIK